jgi:transposase
VTQTKKEETARTTVCLPIALKENWDACALQRGQKPQEVLIEALTRFLKEAGLQPDKRPKTIRVSYD